MIKRVRRLRNIGKLALIGALLLVVSGAAFTRPDLAAGADRGVRSQAGTVDNGESLDDLFAKVADHVPAFGGMFVDEANRLLYVYLSDLGPGVAASAEAALRSTFARHGLPRGRIRVIQGLYGFAELKEWHDRLTADVLGIPGVVLTDIDEARNRLKIGVETLETQAMVEEHLARLGVPRAAVNIEEAQPVAQNLRNRRRPLVGGLQINFPGFFCTLGFNATRANVSGFVTNSHCSRIQGSVEGTVYNQPVIGANNQIGVETVDPALFTGGVCPAGRRCRRSDSLFARRGAGVTATLGRIARPALDSFAWNGVSRFRITSEGDPFFGEFVTKVGRSTGRTQGFVGPTCANFNVQGTNITMLCQAQAGYTSAGGDSGAPVFRITNSPAANDVRLVGIHWGSGGVFSPISGVQRAQAPAELGPLTNCAGGFTC